jgi:hypothetical protein
MKPADPLRIHAFFSNILHACKANLKLTVIAAAAKGIVSNPIN